MDSVGEADRALLNRTANGDRRAFVVLFDRHSRAVTRYAGPWFPIKWMFKKSCRDTFFTTWSKAGRVTIAESSALPWLLVTCRNHHLNLRRKKASSRTETLPHELADVAANDDRVVAAQRLHWVMDEIEALDDIDRRICELCLIEGRSYSEAAAILGKTVGAVGKRLERARTRIRTAVSNLEH